MNTRSKTTTTLSFDNSIFKKVHVTACAILLITTTSLLISPMTANAEENDNTITEIDIEAPTTPIVSLIDTNSSYITFGMHSTDDSNYVIYDIYLNGEYMSSTDAEEYTFYAEPQVNYEVTVVARDNTGNQSEISDVLNAIINYTPPIVPPVTPTIPTDTTSIVPTLEPVYSAHNVNYFSWGITEQQRQSILSYDIYRDGTKIDTIYKNFFGDYYVDRNVQENTTYTYNVVVNGYNNVQFDMSEPLTISTLANPNGIDNLAPSSFKIIRYLNNYDSLFLFWTPALDNFDNVEYTIYRNDVLVGTVTDVNFYSGASVPPASTYVYKIIATDTAGNSTETANFTIQG